MAFPGIGGWATSYLSKQHDKRGKRAYNEKRVLQRQRVRKGRCAQDDYYLVTIEEDQLPRAILRRFQRRIEDVVPLNDFFLLVFFRDGSVKKCSLKDHFQSTKAFRILLNRPDYFDTLKVQPGGLWC